MRKNKLIYLMLGIILFLPFIVANNETENISLISTQNTTVIANCSEELESCVNEFNSMLIDYKAGNNCGNAFLTIKDFNQVLTDERNTCREEVGKIKVYKIGFFIILALLTIISLILIIIGRKENKNKPMEDKNGKK